MLIHFVDGNAGPGIYRVSDFDAWYAKYTNPPSYGSLCSYSLSLPDQLDSMVLTIDRYGPDGVSDRVDDMQINDLEPLISGSFQSVDCP